MHDDDVGLQWRHTTMNDNGWRRRWLLIAARSYYCKPRFANFLILPTYDFYSNDMQSTVILITCQSQSMALKRPAPKSPKLMHRLSKLQRHGWVRRGHCHIRRSAFYHRHVWCKLCVKNRVLDALLLTLMSVNKIPQQMLYGNTYSLY